MKNLTVGLNFRRLFGVLWNLNVNAPLLLNSSPPVVQCVCNLLTYALLLYFVLVESLPEADQEVILSRVGKVEQDGCSD